MIYIDHLKTFKFIMKTKLVLHDNAQSKQTKPKPTYMLKILQ